MIFDEIQEMDKSGQLKRLIKTGVISIKVKVFYDIYSHYKKEFELNKSLKDCKMTTINNTSYALGVCDRTVYRAIKLMEA